jgi:hypothetical protein
VSASALGRIAANIAKLPQGLTFSLPVHFGRDTVS